MMEQLDFILQSFQLFPVEIFENIFSTVFDKAAINILPKHVYLFWFALLLFVALMSLFQNYRNLLKARTIEDTPSSKIRSAAQGYTEISGKQYPLENHPVIAPLSLSPCTWYRYEIAKKNQKNNWFVIAQGQSIDHFLIQDPTGDCEVDPEGADIHPSTHETWYGFSADPQGKSKYKIMLILGFIFGGYQYKEARMKIGSSIYAIGNFSTLQEKNRLSKKGLTARQPYMISNFTQQEMAKKYRLYAILWLIVFLFFMPYSLWWLF